MQTQEIKLILVAKLDEITSSRIGRAEIAIEKNAEEMDAIQQGGDRTLALDSMTRKWETKNLVSEALGRIDSNTYGICEECDDAISPKRLAALPWAKYCIHCQEARDRAASEMRWDSAA